MAWGVLASMGIGALGLTQGRAMRGPFYAQIGIADACNHRCVMCWDHPPEDRMIPEIASRFGDQPFKMMKLEDFKAIVDDLAALGTRRIDIVARGEPLLNKAAIDMVAYAKGLGLYVDMVSNASPLIHKRAEALVAAGLDRLQVSLNAGRPETYPLIHVTESPLDYLKVKGNLKHLTDYRNSLGKKTPYVRVGFVVSRPNHAEIADMVAVAAEVGADEAVFSHTTVHAGTQDLILDDRQYAHLLENIPKAQALSRQLGVHTNLATLAATVPTYRVQVTPDAGPKVVPCYAGWYTVMILGNGSVMGCCQCTKSLGSVGKEQRFRELWNSAKYQAFRNATRHLPTPSAALEGCDCGNCSLRARNLSVHNLTHPFSRIATGNDDQLFTVSDLVRRRKQDKE